jgi:predicted ATPase/DNA-binding winged helix-turn-helix (wHTH) protein
VKDATASGERAFSFGAFRLLPSRQLLLEGDRPVRLGNRSLEILAALVERAGELVTKRELMARVWPDVVVEESNLRVHITALRKALGEGRPGHRYIANVPGRGYRFVAPVEHSAQMALAHSDVMQSTHNLPRSSMSTIGRTDTIGVILRQLREYRIVSLVGPGGIGKTTVALAAADALIAAYEDGIWFVDLAPLRDPQLVPSALAFALGLAIHSQDLVHGVVSHLQDKQLLILLDNCEHVIEAVAPMLEQIVSGAPGVHILATSREPLRLREERVHRLPPLENPPGRSNLTAAEALAFPAVQLFVERAMASREDFELNDADAPIVAEICRKLDGIALAIELAAARMDAFGVHELSALLENGFRLRNQGRRAAPARQQTLAATLDWSYKLLSEDERSILRRLASFAGDFTLDSACALAANDEISASKVVEGVANLVAKSLVMADVSRTAVQYRLLDTTRAYALEKLDEVGESEAVARRHAEHHRDLFAQAAAQSGRRSVTEWFAAYGRKIDDVRAALNWAFSPGGDRSLGVALTVTAIDLWMHRSLWEECRSHIERALADGWGDAQSADQMKLYAALSAALLHTRGPRAELAIAWTKTLEIAERFKDSEHRLRALWGLSSYHRSRGNYRTALSFAEQCYDAAGENGDRAAQLAAERLKAAALFHLGDHGEARRLVYRFLAQFAGTADQPWHAARFPYDQRVGALGILSIILWLQGFPDQAVRTAEKTIEEACPRYSGATLCDVLLQSPLPIFLYVGDWAAAERLLAVVRENLTNQERGIDHAKTSCLEGVMRVKQGDLGGLPSLRQAIAELRAAEFLMRIPEYLGTLAQGLCLDGQREEARDVIDEALEMAERNEERWCLPHLLHIKGEVLQSEDHCRQALDLARQQGALSCELRAAMSLAQLWQQDGRNLEAYELLVSVYDRFAEGYQTSDLERARALIDELRPRLC